MTKADYILQSAKLSTVEKILQKICSGLLQDLWSNDLEWQALYFVIGM